MKKFKAFFLALTLILTPLIHSCLNDGDDNYYLAIATFSTIEDNETYFTLDNGKTMYPQHFSFSGLKNGQRVYVYFDILDEKVSGYDYNIKVRGVEKILTKELFIMNEETADSIGDDKINITDIRLGGGYLTIKFQFLGTGNPKELHMVNLVRNKIKGANENEEEGYASLEFRHNAYKDHEAEVLYGIVSFKGPFTEEDIKGLKVRYKSIYDGIKYIKIDYNKEEEKARESFISESNKITGASCQ